MPSPMNFSTSPPCRSTAGTWQSKTRLSTEMMSVGCALPDIDVKPRRSENQMTQRMSSVWPRWIWPAQDALAGVAADVGVEERGGAAAQRQDLGQARQRPRHGAQRRHLVVGEAARRVGGVGDGVHLAAQKRQRQADVVGEAGEPLLLEDLELDRLADVEPPAQLAARRGHRVDGALDVLLARDDVVRRLAHGDGGGAALPQEAAAHDARVQRAHERGDARDADAGGGELVAEPLHDVGRGGGAGRAVDEPIAERRDVDHLPQ